MNIRKMSPREIDTAISELAVQLQRLNGTLVAKERTKAKGYANPWQDIDAEIDQVKDDILTFEVDIERYEQEFRRRGEWNRVFIVIDGHAHRSTTCRNGYFTTTQWAWLPEWSDMKHEDIVAAAGDRACSWCFPDAPRTPSKLEHPDERAKREAREAREAEKARKQAAAEAKKVYDAEGNQVRSYARPGETGELLKTDRTCGMEITDCLHWALLLRAWSTNPDNTPERTEHLTTEAAARQAHAWYLTQALAAWNAKSGKKITDADQLYKNHKEKARKK
jgi:hypothetical protein